MLFSQKQYNLISVVETAILMNIKYTIILIKSHKKKLYAYVTKNETL